MTPSTSPTSPPAGTHSAALALLLATVFWGCGFTWAKTAADAIHRDAHLAAGAAVGPLLVLACRFLIGGGVMLLAAPAARRGWSLRGALSIAGVGVMLGVSLILQHLGLDLTTEAVSAFLTALTILFVPLLVTIVQRRPPGLPLWVGVGLATVGIWLLTGASPAGFGAGEALGLACALGFSFYILGVNAVSRHENPWQLAAGQFLVTGVLCAGAFVFMALRNHVPLTDAPRLLAPREVWLNVLWLTLFSTLISFGLLNFFQPKLDPTRAALIYLIEPIFAAIFAWLLTGRGLTKLGIAGAALILVANIMVELLAGRRQKA